MKNKDTAFVSVAVPLPEKGEFQIAALGAALALESLWDSHKQENFLNPDAQASVLQAIYALRLAFGADTSDLPEIETFEVDDE